MPMPELLTCWIRDLHFFTIVYKTWFEQFLAYVLVCFKEGVGCSCVDLQNHFIFHRWRRKQVIDLVEKRAHERKQEVNGWSVYHDCQLVTIPGPFKADGLLNIIDNTKAAPMEDYDNEQPDPSPGCVTVSILLVGGSYDED